MDGPPAPCSLSSALEGQHHVGSACGGVLGLGGRVGVGIGGSDNLRRRGAAASRRNRDGLRQRGVDLGPFFRPDAGSLRGRRLRRNRTWLSRGAAVFTAANVYISRRGAY